MATSLAAAAQARTPGKQPPFPGLTPGREGPPNLLSQFIDRNGTSALYDALVAEQRMRDRNGT